MAELSANEKLFHQAARNGDLNLLKKLGKKVNISSISRDIFQCTPLHRAALSGSVESVKFLLDNGAQINAKTLYRNRTPLHFAAIFNTLNVVRCLVEHGAQLDAKDSYNKTAWDKATQLGNFRIAQYLENKMKNNQEQPKSNNFSGRNSGNAQLAENQFKITLNSFIKQPNYNNYKFCYVNYP